MSKNDDAVDIAEKYRQAFSIENLDKLKASSEAHSSTRVEIVYEQFLADRNKFGETGRYFHQVIICNGDVVEWLDGPADDSYPDVFTEADAERVNSHVERYLIEDLTDAATSVTIEAYAVATDLIEALVPLHGLQAATQAMERAGANKEEIEEFRAAFEGKEVIDVVNVGACSKRGGPRRTRSALKTPIELTEFVTLVDAVHGFWAEAKGWFAIKTYAADCVRTLKASDIFQNLDVRLRPDESLLRRLYQAQSTSSPALSPLGLAVTHAAQIMGIALHVSTLTTRYYEGKNILSDQDSV